jgi:leucyl aminopeptidase
MTLPNTPLRPQVSLGEDLASELSDADVLALPFLAEDDTLVLGPGAAELLEHVDLDLLALLEHQGAKGRAGEVVEHVLLSRGTDDDAPLTVLLVGVGDSTSTDLRRAGAAVVRRSRAPQRAGATQPRRVVTTVPALADDAGLRAFVEGLVLGGFRYDLKTGDPGTAPHVVLAGLVRPSAREAALAAALATAGAGWAARTLALVPSNEKTPIWLAERAAEVASAQKLDLRVWDEEQLREGGFGGICGVGQASANPPRLVRLDYAPSRASRRTPHVVLVGKGITFDTGGLSIKPADAMMTMKRDMTGAGVVLSVMEQLAALDCPVKVTGLMACAENSVSGSSLRPGDVIRHYGGRTSEVTNTDAEGRLVLADALAYAVAELKPDVLVDVATLTGAVKVSLGQRTGGLFADDDGLATQLDVAGRAAGEPLWRLPLVADYEERLESKVADADNAAGSPGAITAALFLQHFTGDVPWAHLDIASVGDSPVDAFEWTAGATGFGARLLLHWLEQREPLDGVRAAGRAPSRGRGRS